MRSVKKILVVIPLDSESEALERGLQIAQKLDATLNLLLCDPSDSSSGVLDQYLVGLLRSGVHARGTVARVDFDRASNAILEACRTQSCDLVIKQHRSAGRLSQLLMTPDDWQLLRQVPTPLLLIRGGRVWEGGTVLAGMDVEHQDAAHVALQGNVMEHANFLRGLFGAALHVVSAYSPARLPQADPEQTLDQVIARHCHEQCRWFMEEYELPEHCLHLGEGPARTLIPQIAHQLEAGLTVLGTVARQGLAGALVGNTAEAVLDRLEGDLLVIKPEAALEEAAPDGHRAA
ncbi:universal stress protein [Pseudomonas sp. JS3066]|jgi:nucleotide-binding universal stress UspA family protein|uniref:universal stress protein n=1 Tax=unclassified Pseudomonas TaxID=196821 RepID=UPI000EA9FE3C|nr:MULTISPECIES: universal stress protein [unclassified Pseudomonas]AYF87702.1 universal stress protein UspA [Pseudomonas sp. DY-1]WVK94735.1 universal stress protein [Pseudomonas sp. JS3066]